MDDLFKYLVATDTLDEFLGYKEQDDIDDCNDVDEKKDVHYTINNDGNIEFQDVVTDNSENDNKNDDSNTSHRDYNN